MSGSAGSDFGWGSVARLGLVQACLGSIVVLTTSTLNRVMVVELALPALRHRVSLTAEAEVEGRTVDACLQEMLKTIEVPRM